MCKSSTVTPKFSNQDTKYNLKNSMLPKLHIGLFLLPNHVRLEKFYDTKSVYMYSEFQIDKKK
jgi:hypothetical protein